MPAGQSIKIKWYPKEDIEATRFSIFFRVTLYRCRVLDIERRDKFFQRLSRVKA